MRTDWRPTLPLDLATALIRRRAVAKVTPRHPAVLDRFPVEDFPGAVVHRAICENA